jgi:hypothetical protein
MSKNITKLMIEELAKKLTESVMLEEDDQFKPWQAVLPPPLVYDSRFPPIGLEKQASWLSVLCLTRIWLPYAYIWQQLVYICPTSCLVLLVDTSGYTFSSECTSELGRQTVLHAKDHLSVLVVLP